MRFRENLDPTLRAMGGRDRYQILQAIVANLGMFGAAYQLLDNIFIGRLAEGQRCAAPSNSTTTTQQLQDLDWYASNITYDECAITVVGGNRSGGDLASTHPCLFGYEYSYPRELSFRTEFDLVCGYSLLVGLVQSMVILGQGIGAIISSIVSDRLGRKRTLVGSQLGLFAVGMAIGASPSFLVLAVLKFCVGTFQQGVVGSVAALCIELFPMEHRSMQPLVFSVLWGLGASSMTFFAFTMRHHPWRYLQYTLSAVSLLIAVVQLWYLDESLRWMMANGKKEEAMRVMERASRVNGKKLSAVLHTLQDSETKAMNSAELSSITPSSTEKEEMEEEKEKEKARNGVDETEKEGEKGGHLHHHHDHHRQNGQADPGVVPEAMEQTLSKKEAEKLTILDIFRHKYLLSNALIVWLAWFTCAFSFFTLYMMSATLHGNRFLNYFLTALMEVPPGFLLYYLVDKKGRKTGCRVFYILAGIGLLGGGITRIFGDHSVMATMSLVMAMLGMVGASGLFGAVFFITPELFPTNLRNQSVGMSSFVGRIGGMISPFMVNLAEIAVWAPGAMIGTLCFIVVALFHFLPETKGRELPDTLDDIKNWRRKPEEIELQDKC